MIEDGGKRCFTYCGPERCTCGAGGRDDVPMFAAAKILGNRVGGNIPAGDYWLIECHPPEGQPGHPLYWMDDYDGEGRTGFDYIPQRAALFNSEAEARAAWKARGVEWPHKPRVLFACHQWAD